jgi:hypothetical protein
VLQIQRQARTARYRGAVTTTPGLSQRLRYGGCPPNSRCAAASAVTKVSPSIKESQKGYSVADSPTPDKEFTVNSRVDEGADGSSSGYCDPSYSSDPLQRLAR